MSSDIPDGKDPVQKYFARDDITVDAPADAMITGFVPSLPWDRPRSLPKSGDKDASEIYSKVGEFLDAWEELELRLTMLYLSLIGIVRVSSPAPLDQAQKAQRFYERAVGITGRVHLIEEALEAYSITHCDQDFEGDLQQALREVILFSARRNEIAHGAVRAISFGLILHNADGSRSNAQLECGTFLTAINQLDVRFGKERTKEAFAYNAGEIDYRKQGIMFLRTKIEHFYHIVRTDGAWPT